MTWVINMSRKGFTLIEMLIVIAIISIIFASMAINIKGLQNEARVSKARGDLKTLQIALESYYKNYMYEFPPVDNYQRELIEAIPMVLEGNLIDPFGKTCTSQYIYKLSPNEDYYIMYSIGISGRGDAAVSSGGHLNIGADPVWVSNGNL